MSKLVGYLKVVVETLWLIDFKIRFFINHRFTVWAMEVFLKYSTK
jgi:hypothetical protein